MDSQLAPEKATRRVTVRFGTHTIREFDAPTSEADRYVALMTRQYLGLKVSAGEVPADAPPAPQLPPAHGWEVDTK